MKQTEQNIKQWLEDRHITSNSTSQAQFIKTVEEVGELARIISRRFGEQSFKESDKNMTLEDEIADILFVLICMANQTGTDLTDALKKNLEKKTNRDKKRHLSNKKLKK